MIKKFALNSKKKEKGIALVTVLATMVFVSILFMSMYWYFMHNSKAIGVHSEEKELYYHAKTGIEVAEAALYANKGLEEKKLFNSIIADKSLVFEDVLDNKEITQLPNNVKIKIIIEYNKPAKSSASKKEKLMGDKIKISSLATITNDKDEQSSYELIKYIDPVGINTSYQ